MDSIIDEPRHGVGHNNPPDPIEILRAYLRDTYGPLIARCEELLAMEIRLPAAMDDDWEAKITEAIKSCTKFSRNSEVTRLEANEPHRALIAATDGFFKGMSDKVDALKAKMTKDYLTPYQQKKADAEKRRREEEARLAKARADEEARLAREEAARVAEARRREEAARREAERIETERRQAEERRAAEARAEIERKEAAARDAERLAAEATNKKEREAAAAARAEADRAAEESRTNAEREAAEARAASDRTAAAAQQEIERAAADRQEQERLAAEARDRAAAATQDRNVTAKSAKANAADRSRTRTDLGAVASLRTTYTFEIVDREAIPRAYLEVSEPAINAAIRAATKDGKCTLKIDGVRIFPVTNSVVR